MTALRSPSSPSELAWGVCGDARHAPPCSGLSPAQTRFDRGSVCLLPVCVCEMVMCRCGNLHQQMVPPRPPHMHTHTHTQQMFAAVRIIAAPRHSGIGPAHCVT